MSEKGDKEKKKTYMCEGGREGRRSDGKVRKGRKNGRREEGEEETKSVCPHVSSLVFSLQARSASLAILEPLKTLKRGCSP